MLTDLLKLPGGNHHHHKGSPDVSVVQLRDVPVGRSFAMVIRAELFQPGLQIVELEFFNQMTTARSGWFLCHHAGLCWPGEPMTDTIAPDMALPRMNNWSLDSSWTFLMPVPTLPAEGGGPTSVGRLRATVDDLWPPSVTFIFAVHAMGISSIMAPPSSNRCKHASGMTYMKMPMFV